jgi:hypothetical protein
MAIGECGTWECINSFANWPAAIGTIAISGLALWLSVRDRMVNVKADLNVSLIPGANPSVLDRRVFMLSFTNVGSRPVTVINHVWSLPLSRGFVFLMPNLDPQLGPLCSKLPLELTDGKSGHIFFGEDFFSSLEEPEKVFFHRSLLLAWLRIRFFRVHIGTTVGKRVRVAVHSGVRKKLWRLYRERSITGRSRGSPSAPAEF